MFSLAVLSLSYNLGDQNFDVTDENWQQFIGKGRPVLLRRYFAGCSSLPAFDPAWNEAAKMHEHVLFLNAECLNSFNAPKLCQMIQDDEKVANYHNGNYVSPSHIMFPADSTTPIPETYVGSRKDFQKFQGINDYIYENMRIYPTDIPLRRLDAHAMDGFYHSTPYPTILLYNSSHPSHTTYLNKLATLANDEYPTPERTAIGFLDCNKYESVCRQWGKALPSLEVYRSENGQHTSIKLEPEATTTQINASINRAIDIVNMMNTPVATPAPPTPSKLERPTFPKASTTITDNMKRESRTFDDVKTKYTSNHGSNLNPPAAPWTGTTDKCNVGTYDSTDREAGLKTINFYRYLYGVNELTLDDTHNKGSMEASIMLNNLDYITHTPPDNAPCITETAKKYAADSQLALGPVNSYGAVDNLVEDKQEQNRNVGHRRFVLHPFATKAGIGLTSKGQSDDQSGNGRRSFTVVHIETTSGTIDDKTFYSFPCPGPFPVNLIPNRWHIQSPLFKKVEAKDVEVRVIRTDGTALTPTDAFIDKEGVMGDSLMFYISDKDLGLCVADTTFKVQAYIKSLNTAIEYSVTFCDFTKSASAAVCFYGTAESKCPSTYTDKFNPNNGLPSGKDPIIIYVAEEITLSKEINFDFASKITLTGTAGLKGKVKIPAGKTVTAAYASSTHFEIEYNPADGTSGKLLSAEAPERITVAFTTSTVADNLKDVLRTVIYEGPTTFVTFDAPTPTTEYGYYIFNYQFFSNQYTVNSLIVSRKYVSSLWEMYNTNCLPGENEQLPEHKFTTDEKITMTQPHIKKIRLYYCTQQATLSNDILPDGVYEYEIDINGGSNTITIDDSTDTLKTKTSGLYFTAGNCQYYTGGMHGGRLAINMPMKKPKVVLTKFSIKDTTNAYSLLNTGKYTYYFPNYVGELPKILADVQPTFQDIPSYALKNNNDYWLNSYSGKSNTVQIDDTCNVIFRPAPGEEEKDHVIEFDQQFPEVKPLMYVYLIGYKGRVELKPSNTDPKITKINCENVVVSGSDTAKINNKEAVTETGSFSVSNAIYADLTLSEADATFTKTEISKLSVVDSDVEIGSGTTVTGEMSIRRNGRWSTVNVASGATFNPSKLTIQIGSEEASARLALEKPLFKVVTGLTSCDDVMGKTSLVGSEASYYDLKCVDNALSVEGKEEIYNPSNFDQQSGFEEDNGGGNPSGNGGGLPPGAIAGIVIGIFAALAIISGCLWFFVFRKGSEKVSSEESSSSGEKKQKEDVLEA